MNQQQAQVAKREIKGRRLKIPLIGGVQNGERAQIPLRPTEARVGVTDHVENQALLLSSFVAYEIGNKVEDDGKFTGTFDFLITIPNSETLDIEFKDNSSNGISPELFRVVRNAFADPDVQEYVVEIINNRRRDKALTLTLAFHSGKLHPTKTIVE